MNRPLLASILVLAAAATQAQAASPIGGATMPRTPVQSDALGPKSDPTPTVAEAVARTQIEKSGYTSVRGLQRTGDGTWRAVARDPRNAPVAVALDNQGNVTQAR
ncbi:hypothetical protein [Reyranella soli]|jgi:hypothetical protein|uniref:PepSY domain-containing protein n=1 Tax=Reyranella soli TaxID=1230389 RepID=A0A512NAY0_9HYPH|nr:hypothetical protein [Reyranella soli]GEP56106.1 hypothetical protein RSO01_32720 [Reyranella soli]